MTMIFNGTTGITFPDGQTQDVGVPDPGTNGNVLTSNGTIWTSAAPATPNNGVLTLNTSGTGLSGSQTFSADQASNVTFTVASNANSANGASTIVARDSSGNFTANAVTLTTGSFAGGSNTAPSITFTGDTNTGIFSPAADTIAFAEGGVESMRIDSSGNLLVGTTTTGGILRVFGSSGRIIIGDSSVNYYDGDTQIFRNYAATERMRIDSSGNVGIGTSSPANALQVYRNASAAVMAVQNQTTNLQFQVNDGVSTGAGVILLSGAYPLTFYVNGTERMRITSSGAVGIGTSSPTANLTVRDPNGSSSGNLSLAAGAGGGGASRIIMGNADSGGTAGPSMIVAANRDLLFGVGDSFSSATGGNFTERMRIDALGSLLLNTTSNGYGVTGGIYAPSVYGFTTASAANMFIESGGFMRRSTSSIKYKTDVQDATHGLADVMKLRPVTYKGINDGETVFGGLIAEEVHDAGLTEFVQYADDGSPDALAYGQMVSLCVKAIQEQQAIINELKTRIETLENR